uniref:EGF-like domain-containing protein n=1 Tax=Caenorhabditis japonica TaxID=281687 RepID=A0A8R1I459_CAEJA
MPISDPDDRSEKLSKKRAVHEETNEVQEQVKAELDKAVESLKEAAKEREEEENGLLGPVNLESCGTVDCNHRGTCLGTKKTYICACQLGYSGKNCEDTVCDSARDCNGRGLCLGTTSTLTCLCNLGFSGKHCQTAI